MLSTILIVAAIIGLPLLPILRHRAARQTEGSVRTAPQPAMHPARAPRNTAYLLVLRTDAGGCSCETARHFAGKTFDRATAPKLPLAGCSSTDCRCRFEAIADRRRRPRREASDRRGLIRFSTKSDRRICADRRRPNAVWQSHSL
ncbi:MAG: hypothetical protein E6K53_13695 [Gammaproteobacteria bacterium]|nr:MAG: hypothetical protein E6K53_13695 [Gammaproteobacteria bacterium]